MAVYRALICLLVLLTGAPAVGAPQPDPLAAAAIDTGRLGAAVPTGLVLEDAGGGPVALGDLLGHRPLLLAPVDYDCDNICGITLAGLFAALDELEWRPGEDYDLLVASIDPAATAADAAAARAEHLARFKGLAGAGSGIRFVAGDAAALTAAIGFRYGYDARSEQYIHPAAVGVVTAEGRLARWLYGYPFEAADLRLALTEASGGEVGTISDRLWLLCYGYDPVTGRYSAAIDRLLKAGGGLTVVLLGGFVLALLRRERRGAP